MFEIIQAPSGATSKGIKIFLAGGISNCPNWQVDIINHLIKDHRFDKYKKQKITLYNPRCKEIPEEDPQTTWEYEKLKESDIIIFWFSTGSLNPITLFEYGSYIKSDKTLVIGCHPTYIRRNAVIIQTRLARPDLKVNIMFDAFYEQLVKEIIIKIESKTKWYSFLLEIFKV